MNGLSGKRVVVTRAATQAEGLNSTLRQFGAYPLSYPCIDIRPPANTTPLLRALKALQADDWLLVTSTNTVDVLSQLQISLPQTLRLGAVGPSTAEAARVKLGLEALVIPESFTAEALAHALPDLTGQHVLLPQSGRADSTLADNLRQRGARVTVVTAYENSLGSGGIALCQEIELGHVDAITFTSASTVTNALLRLDAEGGNKSLIDSLVIACMGPKTAEAAQQCGLTVDVIPVQSSIAALCAALDRYFRSSLPGEKEA